MYTYFQKKIQITTVSLFAFKTIKKSAKFNYSDRGVSSIATSLEIKQEHITTEHYVIL
jgi:hypothetical protein